MDFWEIVWNIFGFGGEFFGILWEDFFGGIFWEKFFGRNFLGGIFWEEFFGRNSLFTLLKVFEYERD